MLDINGARTCVDAGCMDLKKKRTNAKHEKKGTEFKKALFC